MKYAIQLPKTRDCRIKKGVNKEGREGIFLGRFYVNNISWSLVLWKDEIDPDLFKTSDLEIRELKWIDIGEFEQEI